MSVGIAHKNSPIDHFGAPEKNLWVNSAMWKRK
jgi:hypothetical protein